MQKSLKYREMIADVRRVVIKIGSRVLIKGSGKPDIAGMRELTRQIAGIQNNGHEVVVVTSGAVGTGMEALGMRKRPESLPDLQMAASVGQSRLMARYDELFAEAGCKVGQVLLTHGNFRHKVRLANARRTMENLIRHSVIPIINENDAVADEEIKADLTLGDNDLLASLVVKLIRADLLILLTTVDGVRRPAAGSRTARVPYIETVGPKTLSLVTKGPTGISKGGMASKLKAARTVAAAGCLSVIAKGRQKDILDLIMEGKDVGTMVLASGT